MRIAQVSPVWESVPPQGYGGIERVVSYMTEELVRQGHDVTLFASGDSRTTAELVATCPRAVRPSDDMVDANPIHVAAMRQIWERAGEFDVVHFHTDHVQFLLGLGARMPSLSTIHGRLDLPEQQLLFRQFRDERLVSISVAQRRPMPGLNWVGNVYHGLPLDLYRATSSHDGYLAFLGRISPEKRPDRAIEIAARTGLPLRIASKLDEARPEYVEEMQPLLESAHVEFVGEVGDGDKQEFLGNAMALVFPIDWPEPFGLVMIEAMACGTPVIAFRNGAVEEIMEHGVTGFICEDVDQAAECVAGVRSLSRDACRERFEKRFDVRRMVSEYVSIYARLAEKPHDEVA